MPLNTPGYARLVKHFPDVHVGWYKGKFMARWLRFATPLYDQGRAFLSTSIDLVLPPICNLCRCELDDEKRWLGLCNACCELVMTSGDFYCPRCGNQRGGHQRGATTTSSTVCLKCKKTHFIFSQVFTLGPYQKTLRNAVLQTKYPYGHPLAVALGRLLAHAKEKEIGLFQPDFIIAIPMHWLRRLKRGVNGPDAVADSIAKYLRVPKAMRAITRFRCTVQQTNLSQTQRLENLKSAFLLLKKNVRGKRILLVDDVMTTGATCNEAARILRSHGAIDVAVAVLSRAGIESP